MKIRERSMKMLKPAAVGAVMLAGVLSAQAQQVDSIRWGVPMAFGSNLVALGDAMPWVSHQLDAASGGRVKLQVFATSSFTGVPRKTIRSISKREKMS